MNVTINKLVEYINAREWKKYSLEENKNEIVTWMTFVTTESDLKSLTGGEIVAIQTDIYNIEKLKVLLTQCAKYHTSGLLLYQNSKLSSEDKKSLYQILENNNLFAMLVPTDVNLLNTEKKVNEYILRMKNVEIVEESFIGEFLFKAKRNEMLSGVEHIESFGLNPLGSYQIAVVKIDFNNDDKEKIKKEQYIYQILVNRLKDEKPHIYAMHFGKMMVIMIEAKENAFGKNNNYEMLCKHCANVKKQFSNIELRATIGRIYSPITNIRNSFDEALFALNMFKIFSKDGQPVINYYDVGFYQILRILHNTEEFIKYYDERIGCIEEYDRENGAELTNSLWVFLENDCNLNKTAEVLFVHINTLRYRFGKIEELTKMSTRSNSDLSDLYICYYIKQYLGMKNTDEFSI